MSGFIRLGDREWPVKTATVGAKLLPAEEADLHWGPGTGGISWHLEVEAAGHTAADGLHGPSLYVQNFVAALRTWHDLEGREFRFPDLPAPDDEHARDRLGICFHDHDDVRDARFRFGPRDGNTFAFTLSGGYAFFRPEPDRLQVEAAITFEGVNVRAPDPAAAWRRLCDHLDGRHFSPDALRPGRAWGVPPSYFGFAPSAG